MPVEPITPPPMEAAEPEATPAAPEKKSFFTSGLVKGLAVTAIAIVGIVALVAGAMGAGYMGGLTYGSIPVHGFEEGAARGIEKALSFLFTTPFGYAALGIGSALGIYREYKHSKLEIAAAPDSQEHAKLLQLTQELQMQKGLTQQLVNARAQTVETPAPLPEKQPNGNALPGSVIEAPEFSACELKRRAERSMEARTV